MPRLQAIIAEADSITDVIWSSGGMPTGEVRVGMLPSTVPMLASTLFALVRERFPRLRLLLREGLVADPSEWAMMKRAMAARMPTVTLEVIVAAATSATTKSLMKRLSLRAPTRNP